MIKFKWRTFSELTLEQLYAVLALRSEIFVVEQQCPYLDPDGTDFHALHLLGIENKTLVAYLRLFAPKDTQQENLVFGRVVTASSARNKGYGKKLIQELLKYCEAYFPRVNIQCSAQFYLKRFYGEFQFQSIGNIYDEDGIPHIEMRRAYAKNS